MSADERNARVIVALDAPRADAALDMAARLSGAGAFKIGFELFLSEGPALVRSFSDAGGRVFLDLKLHDIPHTVAGAMRAAVRMGAWMTNVHATGGSAMMSAAIEAAHDEAARLGRPAPILLAVTVLTSLADADLAQVGLAGPTRDAVLRLATLAKGAGVDGVVCSPHEAADVKREAGADFVCVTPGVRPAWAAANDQKRVMTPVEALAAGADYVVVGRPLIAAIDPAAALARLFEDA